MSKRYNVLVNHERMVAYAVTVGFFYNYGKRQKVCQHRSCGWRRPESRSCFHMRYLEPGADVYYRKLYAQEIKRHQKRGCLLDWCVLDNGARPEGWPTPKPNPCKKTYFRAYTEKEIADPNTKVELVAIQLTVAELSRIPRNNIVCVYDLMNDRWYTDTWWKLTPKGDLSPYNDWGLDYAPSEIAGMEDVLTKVKAGI